MRDMALALSTLADILQTHAALYAAIAAVVTLALYWAGKAAIRRPMELAEEHWSRNPNKVQPKFSKTTHALSVNWVYENCKPTSAFVRARGVWRGRCSATALGVALEVASCGCGGVWLAASP